MSWIKSNSIPAKYPKQVEPALQCLWTQRNYLIIQHETLYRRWEDVPSRGNDKRLQLVLPSNLANDVLSGLHNSPVGGHLGVSKTLDKVRSRFYWVGQRKDVEKWCNNCDKCCSRKSPSKSCRAPLQTDLPQKPFERVAMDILGPLPETRKGNKYILVVGDYFTKWKEAFPMQNMEASTVAKIFFDEFVCRFRIPKRLHTDQGKNFESTLIKELCRLLGITKTRTTPYHPQSDGMVERFNRTLLNLLSIAVEEDKHNWDAQLAMSLLAYQTSMHESTGATPFYLRVLHHLPRTFFERLLGTLSQKL